MNIYENCSLCDNPPPYKCEECMSCIIQQEEFKEIKKIYIGSGEDVCLTTFENFNYD
jgi:7-cyano-7-deazaguanine synthase in queuosine biosynthesis